MSRHLKTLEAAGLVKVVDGDDGRERLFQLETDRLFTVAGKWIAHFEGATNAPDQDLP